MDGSPIVCPNVTAKSVFLLTEKLKLWLNQQCNTAGNQNKMVVKQ